jgi:hypothetical protein
MPRYIDANEIDYTLTVVGQAEYAGYRAIAFESEIDALPTANVVEVRGAEMRQLWSAVYALADMVCQFGYSTKFRKQDALCDGGLSALENALSALTDCGCPTNSNGTITTKKLFQFMDKIDGEWKE